MTTGQESHLEMIRPILASLWTRDFTAIGVYADWLDDKDNEKADEIREAWELASSPHG